MSKFIFPFITIVFLSGCSSKSTESANENDKKMTSIYKIEHAHHFNLKQKDSLVVLQIINPENGEIDKTIEINPSSDAKIISLSSTINGMLVEVEKTANLVGISSAQYIYNQDIKKRIRQHKIQEFGDDTAQSVEKIIASGATVIFHSGFGDKFPNEEQLEKIGISIIPVYDWREEDPLGKAEWIKLIGAITDSEVLADEKFNHTKDEYKRLSALVSEKVKKPTVLSGNMIGDVWYAPVGDSYVARLIADAGGDYVYKSSKGTGSLALSIETILKDNTKTQIWINPGIETKAKVLKLNPHAHHLSCFNALYCYSPNMNKFWEQSAVQPHLFLSDLIHIFHPEVSQIKKSYFFEKIN